MLRRSDNPVEHVKRQKASSAGAAFRPLPRLGLLAVATSFSLSAWSQQGHATAPQPPTHNVSSHPAAAGSVPRPQPRAQAPQGYRAPGDVAPHYASPNYPASNYAAPNYGNQRPGAPAYPPPPRPLITAQPPSGSPQQAPRALPPSGIAPQRNPYATAPAIPGRQQHLGSWLASHQGQSFATQEQSLRQEPGFSRLPQPQQQRLIDRLHQLDTMPPDQRQRTLGRIENMERLTPDRRDQVRASAQELGAMPDARKRELRSAFRSLRELPPGERQQQLQSPEFRSQYSDHERQMLSNLLSVEPYNPR